MRGKILKITEKCKEIINKIKSWYNSLPPKKQVLTLIGSGFLLFIIVWAIFDQPPRRELNPLEISQTQQDEIWTCPMHPHIRESKPGQCPICGMDLVKVKTGDGMSHAEHDQGELADDHAKTTLNLTAQQKIGVKWGKAEVKPLVKEVTTVGRAAYDPELYTAQREFIESLSHWKKVKDSPLEAARHSAEQMVESSKLRLKILGLSDEQIDSLSETGKAGGSLLLPQLGENAWIYADVYEMDLPDVKSGLKAEISGRSLEGKTLEGEIISIDRVINPKTRSAKARIEIKKVPIQLWPEAYFDVSILIPMGEKIVVPTDAVLQTGKEAWVFIADGKGGFEPRKVIIGVRAGDEVSIEKGLSGGENIVTSANFLIDSESRIKGAIEAMQKDGVKKPDCPPGQEWNDPMQMCM